MSEFVLYSYFRSSAAFRVRIALQLKKIPFEYLAVHLLKDGGQQYSVEYKRVNPMSEVPTLVHNGHHIAQSMAIISYLDAVRPNPPLFPQDPLDRAKVTEICEHVNAGIHPVQNLKVLQELEKRYGINQEAKNSWATHWIEKGFEGIEPILKKTAGNYSYGNRITAADCFLIPQVYNAKIRYKLDMSRFPAIDRVYNACLEHQEFKAAEPESQPDYTR